MMEPASVGQDRDVQIYGDLLRHGYAEVAHQVEDHLAAGGRRLVNPIERAVQGVADAVVDVKPRAENRGRLVPKRPAPTTPRTGKKGKDS